MFKNISTNQHLDPRFHGDGNVWLHAVLACAESDSCRVSLRGVTYLALISRISPRKRIFQQNHFSLFMGHPVYQGLRWISFIEKNAKTISWHCHFTYIFKQNVFFISQKDFGSVQHPRKSLPPRLDRTLNDRWGKNWMLKGWKPCMKLHQTRIKIANPSPSPPLPPTGWNLSPQ